jgi:hypothetical protein
MFCNRLNSTQQGIVLMIFGIILLLHTLGLFEPMFYYVLLFAALCMIICGFIQAGLYQKIMSTIKKEQK